MTDIPVGGYGGFCATPYIPETSKELQVKSLMETAKEYGVETDISMFVFVMKKVYGDTNGIIDSVMPSLMDLLEKYLKSSPEKPDETEVSE